MTWVPGNLGRGAAINANKVGMGFLGCFFFGDFLTGWDLEREKKWGLSIKTSQATQPIWVNGSQFKSGYFLLVLNDVGRGSLWVSAKLEVWVKKQ